MYLAGLGKAADAYQPVNGQACAPGYVLEKFNELFLCRRIAPDVIPASPSYNPPQNITVSPVIQTTVSPQVSPAFVQQQQPTNSPVNATPVMATPSAPAQQMIDPAIARQIAQDQQRQSDSAMQDYLAQQQAMYDAQLRAASQGAQQPAVQSAPSVVVVPGSNAPATPENTDASLQTPIGAFSMNSATFNKLWPYLLAGLGGLWYLERNRNKKRGRA